VKTRTGGKKRKEKREVRNPEGEWTRWQPLPPRLVVGRPGKEKGGGEKGNVIGVSMEKGKEGSECLEIGPLRGKGREKKEKKITKRVGEKKDVHSLRNIRRYRAAKKKGEGKGKEKRGRKEREETEKGRVNCYYRLSLHPLTKKEKARLKKKKRGGGRGGEGRFRKANPLLAWVCGKRKRRGGGKKRPRRREKVRLRIHFSLLRRAEKKGRACASRWELSDNTPDYSDTARRESEQKEKKKEKKKESDAGAKMLMLTFALLSNLDDSRPGREEKKGEERGVETVQRSLALDLLSRHSIAARKKRAEREGKKGKRP